MEHDICLRRNIGTISPAQQRKLAGARIAVAGLGGVGGIAAELLVRAGVGKMMAIDFDRFEKTNFNRQIHAQKETAGKMKVDVFAKKMKQINAKIHVKTIAKKIEYANMAYFAAALCSFSPHIVIDTMDSVHSRVCLARICKKLGVPYVYAAAMGGRGMVGVLKPANNLEKLLRLPSFSQPDKDIHASLIHYPQCKSAWGPATNLVGVLAANAALNKIIGKKYPASPKFLMIDVFGEKIIREEKLA